MTHLLGLADKLISAIDKHILGRLYVRKVNNQRVDIENCESRCPQVFSSRLPQQNAAPCLVGAQITRHFSWTEFL